MSRYFFVCPALPELRKDQKPAWSFTQVMDLFKLNFSADALDVVGLCNLWSDLVNYEALLYGLPADSFGNIDSKNFEKSLVDNLILFDFLDDYRRHFASVEDQKKHFAYLHFKFFETACQKAEGFLLNYYKFSEEILTVATALRAKKLGREIEKELSLMNKDLPLAMEAIITRDKVAYQPTPPYEALVEIYENHFEDPRAQHAAFFSFLFDWIEEQKETMSWGLDYASAYLIQLRLLTKLHPDDAQVPFNILEQIGEKAS
jgi:hypothetical protein